MRIVLVKPPQVTDEIQPPLGLGYLASSIRGVAKVRIIDSIKDKLKMGDISEKIKKGKFDVVGFQCYTVDFNIVKELVRRAKEIRPKPLLVVGGPHPTLDPINTMKYMGVDYAFLGDSEESFSMFVKLLKNKKLTKNNLKKIPGFAYRDKDKIRKNKISYPKNLDKYDPSWELYGMENYPLAPHGAFCKQSPIAPLVVTRGCPFNCAYCGASKISGRKIRSHTVNFIIKQINLLVKKYGIREIHIEDDNFTMNRKFIEKFCKELIRKKFGITWTCPNGVRVDTLDKRLLMLMKRSGLYSLSVGIESGSDRVRELMRKNLDTKTIEEKIKLIRKCGIDVIGFFIVGYPGETVEDIKKTIDFACRLDLKRATFSAFKPFPGTDVYNELVRNREINKLDYDKFSLDKVVWAPKEIGFKKLKNLRRRAFIKFYIRPKILFKMLGEIKNFENFKFILLRTYRWLIK